MRRGQALASRAAGSERETSRFLGPACAGLALLLLAACAHEPLEPGAAAPAATLPATDLTVQPRGAPIDGGSMAFALAAESPGWNPVTSQWAGQAYQVARAIFDPLAAVADDGSIRPYLAQSFEPNGEFTEWTITLRPGVTFHDGTPLTASVLQQNLEAQRASPTTGLTLRPITAIAVVGELSVKVTMSEPFSSFPGYLTAQMGFVAAPSMLADPASANRPVGTGPFRFESWTRDTSLKVKKNPNYWQKGLPHLDEIEFKVIEDTQSRVASFHAGDVDVMELNTAGLVASFEQDARAGKNQFFSDKRNETPEIVIPLNTSRAPFDDISARRAVAHAINTEELAAMVFSGVYVAADGPLAPGSPLRVESDYPRFDPVKARELVQRYEQERGQKLTFEILIPPDVALVSITQFVQQSLRDVGIEVQIRQTQQAALVAAVFTNNYQAAGWISFGSGNLEGEHVFLDGRNVLPPGQISINITQWKDQPTMDALRVMRSSTGEAELKEAVAVVQRRLGEQVPYIFLVRMKAALAADKRVHGIGDTTLPDGSTAILDGSTTWLHGAWVEQA